MPKVPAEDDASRQDPATNQRARCARGCIARRSRSGGRTDPNQTINRSSRRRSISLRLSEREGARTARRKDLTMRPHDRNRELIVRRALGAASTGARLHQTCRPVNRAEKCPLTVRHLTKTAVAAAEEQECRALLEKLRWETSRRPKQNTRRMVTSVLRLITSAGRRRVRRSGADRWRGTRHSTKPREASEERAVQERTVRHQAVHGTP